MSEDRIDQLVKAMFTRIDEEHIQDLALKLGEAAGAASDVSLAPALGSKKAKPRKKREPDAPIKVGGIGSKLAGSLSLDADQENAVRAIVWWWKNGTGQQKVFVCAGYAGVGKSTVVKYAIQALGIDEGVQYVTFTGKAALVLTRKGSPACTIHSLIYKPVVSKYICPRTHREKERVTGFVLRQPEELEMIRLLVVDEVSMVSGKLLADLMSFGIPMLVLGDPEQLPPVQAEPTTLLDRPDVFLTQIHRQAAGNPILWASMRIREGHTLPYAQYGSNLLVVPRSYLTVPMLATADQVICGKNHTRRYLNDTMRNHYGHTGLPKKGEKLISLKNDWETFALDTPLINGWIGRNSHDVREADVRRDQRTVEFRGIEDWDRPEVEFTWLEANLDYFEPEDPDDTPDTHNKHHNFDYAYAITTHKSQGSEFPHVIYLHEPFGGSDFARKLMYTGATRASEFLTIVI